MNNILNIDNLSVDFNTEYGVLHAVDNVSFTVSRGQVVGIVGESGCGKTVTALAIMRLLDNVVGSSIRGNILFEGQDLLSLSEKQMHKVRGNEISMIFQEPMTSLNPVLNIKVQMNEILIKHQGLDEEIATQKSIEMLDSVGIPNPEKRINEYPHQFSGGMKQRVMIAMALQCNPALLIADEPTTALDVTIQAQILDLMMTLKEKREDAAILLITHDLAVIAETCDRVIVMYGGKIQEIATIDELFNNPLHPYTKALMQSIPKLDKKEKRLKTLKGMVPSILELGDGCKLCSRFDPIDCACGGTGIEPKLLEYKDNHLVRCNPDIL